MASTDTPTKGIETIFRLATSRKPTVEEVNSLAEYLEEELTYFKDAPDKATEYLAIGEYHTESDLDQSEMAAYAMLASAIFNLDESISRG